MGEAQNADLAVLTELGICRFHEDVNDPSMCACGLPALDHDEVAAQIVRRDYPVIFRLLDRLARLADQFEADANIACAGCDSCDGTTPRVLLTCARRLRAALTERGRPVPADFVWCDVRSDSHVCAVHHPGHEEHTCCCGERIPPVQDGPR